jgi:hypothetical protein
MQCKRVINHVRAFCNDKKDWPQLQPAIAIGNSVVTSLGCSPFMALYGVLPRMSFEWDYFHSDKECPPKQLQIALRYANKLEIMRKILQQNVQDCYETTERKYNKTARPQEFTKGMRVYLNVDHHQPGTSPKHSPLYSGPFQILEVKNGVLVKLQHLFTSRCIKNWINVSKLRRISDNHDILHKRFQTSQTPHHFHQNTRQADGKLDHHLTSRQADANAFSQDGRNQAEKSGVETRADDSKQTQQLPICVSNHATCPETALQNMPQQKCSMTNTDCTRTDQNCDTAELVSESEFANRRAKSPRERLNAQNSRPVDDENRPGTLMDERSQSQLTSGNEAEIIYCQSSDVPASATEQMSKSSISSDTRNVNRSNRGIDSQTRPQAKQHAHELWQRDPVTAMGRESPKAKVSITVNIPTCTAGSLTSTTNTSTRACTTRKQKSAHKLSPYAQPFIPSYAPAETIHVFNENSSETVLTRATATSSTVNQYGEQSSTIVHTDVDDTTSAQQHSARDNQSIETCADETTIENENAAFTDFRTIQVDHSTSTSVFANPSMSSCSNDNATPMQREVKSINGKRIIKRQAWYKIYFNDSEQPQWIKAQELPTHLLIEYNAKKYKQRKRAAATRRKAFDQC